MNLLFIILLLNTFVFANDKFIEVFGECTVKVIPDRGSILITSESQNNDQKKAVSRTNEMYEQFKSKVEKLKLKNLILKTSSYQVVPVREWSQNKMIDKGYKASVSLEVTTSDISKLGEVFSLASSVGINNVGSLNLSLSDKLNKDEYLKCLDTASKDAFTKAQRLSKKLNFSLGKVIRVQSPHNNSTLPSPYPGRMEKMSLTASDSPASISIGEINLEHTIHVRYEIK